MREVYFCRQSSAKTEAMGRSGVALDGDVTSINFNPSGIANLKGI